MLSRSLLVAAALVATCAAAAPSIAAAQTLTFDAASSFASFNLPGSPFLAGYTNALGGDFIPYTSRDVLVFNNAQTLQTYSTGTYQDAAYTPGTFLAGPTGVNDPSFTPKFGPNVLGLHPGAEGQYSVIRFIAPIAGSYSIRSRFYGLDASGPNGGTTTGAVVLGSFAGAASHQPVAVNGFGDPSAVRLDYDAVDLAQGQVIDFAVGNGGNGYTYDMTALDAQVSVASTTTPEPASIALVGAGVVALGAAVRRRQRQA